MKMRPGKLFLIIFVLAGTALLYSFYTTGRQDYGTTTRKLAVVTSEDIDEVLGDETIFNADGVDGSYLEVKDFLDEDQTNVEPAVPYDTSQKTNSKFVKSSTLQKLPTLQESDSAINSKKPSFYDWNKEKTSLDISHQSTITSQKDTIDKLLEIANNETLFTNGHGLVPAFSPDSDIDSKRKRLEMYLSRLPRKQFSKVYKTVMGDETVTPLVPTSERNRTVPKTVKMSLLKKIRENNRNKKPCINGCRTQRLLGQDKGYSSRVAIEAVELPDQWNTPQEVVDRLEERKQRVKDVCHRYGLDEPSQDYSVNAWEFLINPKHKLVWCSVFKAASSTWFYNFNILAGYTDATLMKAKETPVAMARKKYPRPSKDLLARTMNETEKPLSFIIVRHPLTRLVSGYRDKLLPGRRYYNGIAQQIVKRYPHLGAKKVDLRIPDDPKLKGLLSGRNGQHKRMVVPTFPQFVQYIIDSNKKGDSIDEHWAPIHKFCTPCLFDFDVIAKMETLDDDGNFIIFKSEIQDLVKPKLINRNRNAPTDKVAESFLCQLSTEMMKGLIDVYKYDMEMFDYGYQEYLNCTTDQVRVQNVKIL